MILEKEKLTLELEQEKKDRQGDIRILEKEKIVAQDKMRRDFLIKMKEVKASLLSLNEDQTAVTTRLTIQQNRQLTEELEYQSKQTEHLLFKNNKMKHTIDTMKRDVQIHQDVEKELAKRSHFC